MKWNVKMEVHVLLLEMNSSAFALQHSKEDTVKKVLFQLYECEYFAIANELSDPETWLGGS